MHVSTQVCPLHENIQLLVLHKCSQGCCKKYTQISYQFYRVFLLRTMYTIIQLLDISIYSQPFITLAIGILIFSFNCLSVQLEGFMLVHMHVAWCCSFSIIQDLLRGGQKGVCGHSLLRVAKHKTLKVSVKNIVVPVQQGSEVSPSE